MSGGRFPVPYALTRKVRELPSRLWSIEEEFVYDSSVPGVGRILVPKGFLSDGCSVPEAPVVYLLAGGKADEAGYVHDYLYTTRPFPREVCDQVLREAVITMGYSDALAQAFYVAVREFGGSHWGVPKHAGL